MRAGLGTDAIVKLQRVMSRIDRTYGTVLQCLQAFVGDLAVKARKQGCRCVCWGRGGKEVAVRTSISFFTTPQ